ncbi:hypothetical protein KY313_03605 [Candidatus Woesearchaeota archaeon]|nr:hypothetical protein [Candidatus Woesearchaeota archaeon]
MKECKVNWYKEVGLKEGNNNGFIYGIYFLADDKTINHADWYKTEEERNKQIIQEEKKDE